MAWHPIREAVQCPCCSTWVEKARLCSWCTIDLATGSWQRSDPPLAQRELRHHWSPLEFGPTQRHLMLDARKAAA